MIDNSYLLGLFGQTGFGPAGGLGGVRTLTPRKTPTAPWASTAPRVEPSALLRSAMSGARFLDESAARLDVKGAAQDYRKLFALHQGLNMLNAVVNRADADGLSSGERGRVEAAFARGLSEVGAWLGAADFDKIRLVANAAAAEVKSGVGVARQTNRYLTGPVHQGAPDAEAAAFAGDVAFRITVGTLGGPVDVDIDLADMGATPRSLTNVLTHINAALEAAGVQTRLGREKLPAEPRTIQVGGRTVTLPEADDRWAMAVKGSSVETVRFSAAATADAVYVAQTTGAAGGPQLLKFHADTGIEGGGPPPARPRVGETQWVDGRALQVGLGPEIAAVRASAAGPDGSLYVLAETTGPIDGQAIKGARDVALIKYDSAGQVVFTRVLGAADSATGGALAVSADGRVAVAGAVTGALDRGSGADPGKPDSFVTVFDAEGVEQWTQRRGAAAEDEATGVAFGEDGSVYVVGRARSAVTGAAGLGGWDGYLQGFTSAGTPRFTRQFGGAGDDAAAAVAVENGVVVVAGTDSGRAVLRRFELQPAGGPLLTATRDLGALSGEIAGLALDGGRVILAGQTRNGALAAGTVTQAHAGGSDAFVASLDAGLLADAGDRLTFLGGAGADTAAAMTVVDGKVWITGQADVTGEGDKQTASGWLSRVDPQTGAVEWTRAYQGDGGVVAPAALAVSRGGGSVLDRLGLPQGEIDFTPEKSVAAVTAARVGDQFHIDLGGRLRTITIEAQDTLATLARKITLGSQNRLKAEVVKDGDVDRLKVTLRNDREPAEIVAGAGGRDALEALGLAQTLLTPVGGTKDGRAVFGLQLPGDLHLRDKAAIKAAGVAVQAALGALRSAYRELERLDRPPSMAAAAGGKAPAYYTQQLANYQAALSRLTGGG